MNRITWIDTAKGIGIILVVLFHFPNISKINYFSYWGDFITTFYMPYFFIISGLFYNKNSLSKRIKRLMVPYIIFYTLGFVYNILYKIIKNDSFDFISFFNPFLGDTINYYNTPIWFLLSLTQMSIIGYILFKYMPNYIGLSISCIISLIGFFWGNIHSYNDYYISVSFLCLPLFIGANTFKNKLLQIHSVYIGLFFIMISFTCFLLNPIGCNVSQCHIPCTYIQFIIISVFASIGLIIISAYIDKIKFIGCVLRYYGKNSIIVLCTHMMLMFIPVLFLKIIPIKEISLLISLIIMLLIEVPIIEFINKKIPFILGR